MVGASGDSVASQGKFAKKYDLPFALLADEDHKVAKAYGVWGKKKYMGKEYDGITRSTFLIDPSGKVAKEWRNVKVDGHDQAVLSAIPVRL